MNRTTLGQFSPVDRHERFWAKVDKSGGPSACWIWTGYVAPNGYGFFTWSHEHSVNAHRASWVLSHGEIPKGLSVLHKCDRKPCVNPAHLELGTPKKNADDAVARGLAPVGERNGARSRRDRLATGDRNGSRKHASHRPTGKGWQRSPDLIKSIAEAQRLSREGIPNREIATRLGVHISTVQRHLKQG